MYSGNKIHDAFDSVRASEELKSLTKDYLRAARQQENSGKRRAGATRPVFRQAFGTLCAAFVLFLGIGGYVLLGIPVSYVSIDVNPSIELALNRLDRVISAEAYNEDGVIILDSLSVKGKYYTDVIEQVVECEAMQPYLSENAGLTFTVASDSSQRESTLLNGIENTSGCREHGGMGFGADIGTVQEAHENGLSLGKYAAYQVLSQYDSTITTEDCHNMTMSEIHGLIEEHAHGGGHDGDSGHHGNNGNGADIGQGYGGGAGQGMGSDHEDDPEHGGNSGYDAETQPGGHGDNVDHTGSEGHSGYEGHAGKEGYSGYEDHTENEGHSGYEDHAGKEGYGEYEDYTGSEERGENEDYARYEGSGVSSESDESSGGGDQGSNGHDGAVGNKDSGRHEKNSEAGKSGEPGNGSRRTEHEKEHGHK